MPKGEGMLGKGKIADALQADVDSFKVHTDPVTMQNEEVIQRISITIPDSMLKQIDRYIFEQKQKGNKINRSGFICETIAPKIEELNSMK